MANHLSAIKAHRTSQRRALVNSMRRSRMRTLTKKFLGLVEASDKTEASTFFRDVQANIMRNVSKGLLHKKTAMRRISRLALKLK